MRKVTGTGETILDIIFENGQPRHAVVGGSVLNGLVSLSRLGVPATFISEVGDDRVGGLVCSFLSENGINTDYIERFAGRKSPVSLAFLDADRNAEYIFHTDYPPQRLTMPFPEIHEDDIFVFGSYYALNPSFRQRFVELLEEARRSRALICYDPNYRDTHQSDRTQLRRFVSENCGYATIVRGSEEDFQRLYETADMDAVYSEIIRQHCGCLITTHGAEGVTLYANGRKTHFESMKITPVSTIGAGDNFNAGIVYGLMKYNIGYRDVAAMDHGDWAKVIQCGITLSAEVCCSYSNYISPEFAERLIDRH
jgi:fructokinase